MKVKLFYQYKDRFKRSYDKFQKELKNMSKKVK